MQRISKFALITLMLPAIAFAQKKNFTIAEATNGMATTLATKGIKQASWQPETSNLYQVDNNAWVCTNVANGKVDTVLTLKKLNHLLFGKDSLKAMPTPIWIAKDQYYFNSGDQLNSSFVGKDTWISKSLPKGAENIFVAPETQYIAFTVGNNLWLNDNKVTNESNPNIISGKAVHRDEFGIDRGIFFSPKGNLLAYYRMDQTMVNDYPIVDWSVTPAKANNIKYPMAGGTSHHVSVLVYNPKTKQSVRIKTGTPLDKYLT